jgi:hypothetical protein
VSGLKQLRGLARLAVDATTGASSAIERAQKGTAHRVFVVLEAIPVVAPPARAVHIVHDACVGLTHVSIRAVTRGVGAGIDLALGAVERYGGAEPGEPRPTQR